jgi:hypothetical protein
MNIPTLRIMAQKSVESMLTSSCQRREYGELIMPANGRWDLIQRLNV